VAFAIANLVVEGQQACPGLTTETVVAPYVAPPARAQADGRMDTDRQRLAHQRHRTDIVVNPSKTPPKINDYICHFAA